MTWIRIESSVARNRKFVNAGPGPSWLWICGLAYCQEGLTDGFIPDEAIDYLGVKGARSLVKHLVSAGLWDVVDGGWQVHDYLEHNKSAAEMRLIFQERRKAGRNGGRASGLSRRSTDTAAEAHVEANVKQVAEASVKQVAEASAKQPSKPALLCSDQISTDQHSAAPARPCARKSPIHDASHRKHAFCGRICMPVPLFDEFVRRRNSVNADAEIIDWAIAVDNEWADGGKFADVEPGEPYVFWKARYAEKWGDGAPSKAESRLPAWARGPIV